MVQCGHQHQQDVTRFSRLCRPKFISLFGIAALLLLGLLSVFLFFSFSSSTSPHHLSTAATPPPQIHQACRATRDPSLCEAALAQPPDLRADPTPLQIIQHSILSTFHSLQAARSMTKSILDSDTNSNVTDQATNCLESLFYSEYRLNLTAVALPRGRLKDARAWMSASLGYQYGCWSGLSSLVKKQPVNNTQLVNDTIAFMNSSSIALTSSTLSMMMSYDLFGEKLELWAPPRTERDGLWEDGGVSGADLGFKGGFPSGLTVDVTVCKEEGKGCVKTVQEAVNGAPNDLVGRRFVIKIDEGVYEEIVRVPIEKRNVVFLGDGMGRTIITGALTVGQPGMNTYNTATVGVVGDGFMARDITFQNTAGPATFQAVAFRSSSDLSIIENCEFLGHQDTLYVHSLRQFYKSCRIEGNIDFIFGNAAAIIQDSTILIRPRQQNPEQGSKNPVTALGRTDPAQSTGIVIQNSVINGTEEYVKLYRSNPKIHLNYLGRPWKEYCRTVFIHCTLGEIISPEGWMPWDGDFALSTVYYGEFENTGPGANVTHRVPWSSQIPKEHVLAYSVENFIQGNEWIATS